MLKNLFLTTTIFLNLQFNSLQLNSMERKMPDIELAHNQLSKHFENIRRARIERFNQEADKKGLIGLEREIFITRQWKLAAQMDQFLNMYYEKQK